MSTHNTKFWKKNINKLLYLAQFCDETPYRGGLCDLFIDLSPHLFAKNQFECVLILNKLLRTIYNPYSKRDAYYWPIYFEHNFCKNHRVFALLFMAEWVRTEILKK